MIAYTALMRCSGLHIRAVDTNLEVLWHVLYFKMFIDVTTTITLLLLSIYSIHSF